MVILDRHKALQQKTENQVTVKIKVIIYKLCGELLWNNIWNLEIEMDNFAKVRCNRCKIETFVASEPAFGFENRWQFCTKNFFRDLIWYAWFLWEAFRSKVMTNDFDIFFSKLSRLGTAINVLVLCYFLTFLL